MVSVKSNDLTILVTGGAGYIGCHTVVELLNAGYKTLIVDNFFNASIEAIRRIEKITGLDCPYVDVDITNPEALDKVFKENKIDAVIHFAALKAVGESGKIPLDYYRVNVSGTINLIKAMKDNGCTSLVYSSSATVYGDATRFENMIPIPEECPLGPTSPYGMTKYFCEQIIQDYCTSDDTFNAALLRYFNPAGAHPSGLMGEDPHGIPNNLLPFLAQVAVGRREYLSVFGNDYKSKDGTPIRDYIHVVDLAKGHIAALKKIVTVKIGCKAWNLGTGKGSTVIEMINYFSKAVGRELPYRIEPRRKGDVLDLTARVTKANEELEWKAELSIEQACKDLWTWQSKNPYGYGKPE